MTLWRIIVEVDGQRRELIVLARTREEAVRHVRRVLLERLARENGKEGS